LKYFTKISGPKISYNCNTALMQAYIRQ